MDLAEALTAPLRADPGVIAAWLFGSRALNRARLDSDVDVAVLLDRPPTGFLDYPFELEAALTDATRLPVQLVVANTAPADLVRRVLRDGVLLVDRDPARRVAFEVKKRMEYFDMAPIWREIRRLPPGVDP
jgi:hypothetical protein